MTSEKIYGKDTAPVTLGELAPDDEYSRTLNTTEQQTLWRMSDHMRSTFYRLTAAYEREIKRETGAVCALFITPIDSVFVDAQDKDDCEIAAQFLATTTRITWDGSCAQIHKEDGCDDWTAYLVIPPACPIDCTCWNCTP